MYALVEDSRSFKISLGAVLAFSLMLECWYLFAVAAVWCLFQLRTFITNPDPAGAPEKNSRVQIKSNLYEAPFNPYDVELWANNCYSSAGGFTVDNRVAGASSRPRFSSDMPRKGDGYISGGDHPYFTQEGYDKMLAFLDEECRRNEHRAETEENARD